ncbi:testicular acid phosphatase homolog [Anoplophora glabripennis]|uniref:testicular acid phosphatase homolog n=1 Tax=Anoplophora glabripennis TaxID=217634 RepID=UPI00087384BC|nr:testicular acid phosphatase homolog [Anoplophora glabripennis]
MRAHLGVIFLILGLHHSYGLLVKNLKDDTDELVAVTVLYRDGARSPSKSFPNDPYYDLSYFPMGFGQLTQYGRTQQYELGQWLRSRYSTFLSEDYHVDDIYVRSTDTDRTLMSALANLAGLYPPKGDQLWNKDILWQPISVHTLPTNEDQVLYMERPCPKFNRLYDEVTKNHFFQSMNEEFADFYEQLSNLTGWNITDVSYIYQLHQVLDIYANYDKSYLPSWASNLDQAKLDYLAGLSFISWTFTDELKRLGDGPFFDNLFSGFDKVLDETQQAPNFLMLSGHEGTIGSVLNGMGLFDYKVPDFASTLIWEVKKSSEGEHYVNMFYKRHGTEVVDQLKLFECDYNCKYETFKSILNPITVDLATWDKECAETD